MCGIVALIAKNKFDYKCRKVFETILYVDTLRGKDSTGIFTVNKYGNVDWAKQATTAESFLADAGVKRILTDMTWDYRAVVGHNRSATRGSVTDENAHPFVEDNVILVHNGTLLNHKDLNDTVAVDSHAIAHAIKEHGVQGAIAKLEGAFAVVGYDIDTKSIFAFRNQERPLWLVETEIFWGLVSEPWMLYGACWRDGIKIESMKEILPATLMTFNLNEDIATLTSEEVSLYVKPQLPAVIIPFPSEEKQTAKKSDLPYAKGDTICFSPVGMHDSVSSVRINGLTEGGIKVNCYLAKREYSQAEINFVYNQTDLVGTVGACYISGEDVCVYAENVTASMPIVTINGMVLNEEHVSQLDSICSRCNSYIEEEELEATFIKYRSSRKKPFHLCPVCVQESLAKNSNWGGIKAYETSCSASIH